MSISAVGCTPIKPQVSFGNDEQDYKKAIKLADGVVDNYVSSSDIKTPGQVVASVGVAGLKSFITGLACASVLARVSQGKLPKGVHTVISKGANLVKDTASNLANATVSKKGFINKAVNGTGDLLGKAEGFARNLYHKHICPSLAGETAEKAQELMNAGFKKIGGFAAVASLLPPLLSRDADGDGVKDIVQKSQNAYTAVQDKYSKLADDVSAVSEIVSLLT